MHLFLENWKGRDNLGGLVIDEIRGAQTPAARTDAVTTTFCPVVPNGSSFSVWKLLHVAFVGHIILMCLLDFWKICTPLDERIILKSSLKK
jgi:hypothetical protein